MMKTASAGPGARAIDLYARETSGFEARIEQTVRVLERAARDHAGQIVQASSLGVEDQVITDLIVKYQLPIAVATLQTGRLHEETLELIELTERRYSIAIEAYGPDDEAVVHFVERHGDQPMRKSVELRKACCSLRKIEPLARLLAGRDAWVTGLRKEQSDERQEVAFEEEDGKGRIKFSPLAEWSWADVWHYVKTRDVPYNVLHDQFFPSIGCQPCTRAVAVGEDFRAGRWWWEQGAKECGLHVDGLASELPPLDPSSAVSTDSGARIS